MSERNGTITEESLAERPVTYRGPVQGLADLAELLGGESSDSRGSSAG